MQIKPLLVASMLFSAIAVLPALSQNNCDSGRRNTNAGRAVQLVPQWSLPFQGQLSADSEASQQLSVGTGRSVSSLSGDLALFKPKKCAVLSIAPPIGSNSKFIASADSTSEQEATASVSKNGKVITGEVSAWGGPLDVDHIINHLVDSHFENSTEGKKLDEQVKRLSNFKHKVIAATKDGVNQAIEYQGVGPSVRAGKLILDSHDYKIRNNAWAEYERQRYIDKIHAQVVSSLMEIAEGIGTSESERGAKSIAAGKEALTALVGADEAGRAVTALTHWLNNVPVSYASFAQTPWSTMERNDKLEEVLKAAVRKDPVITEVTKREYKYAHPNKFNQYSSGAIQGTLDAIAIFAPGFLPGIAAATAEVGYKLSTGGTELNKLERELLLDKRIQSRLKVLTQESSLALDSYRYALVTKNPALLAFSEEVLGTLTGRSDEPELASAQQNDYHADALIPEIRESTPAKDTHRLVKIPFVN